jgi:hypothetical protein
MKIKINPAAVFTFMVLLVLVGALITSREWSFATRLFPWVIAIPALCLCAIQLMIELYRAKKPVTEEDVTGIMDLPVDKGVPLRLVVIRALNIFGWVFGLFVAIMLVGLVLSAPLFVWLYLTVQAREKWWISLIWTGFTLLFLLGLFHYVLHVPWPQGAIPGPQERFLEWIGN